MSMSSVDRESAARPKDRLRVLSAAERDMRSKCYPGHSHDALTSRGRGEA